MDMIPERTISAIYAPELIPKDSMAHLIMFPSVALALAATQAEVLGMGLVELGRGHQKGHGVALPVGDNVAISTLGRFPTEVLLVVGTPLRGVGHFEVVVLTELHSGTLRVVERTELPLLEMGNAGKVGRVPANAQFIL